MHSSNGTRPRVDQRQAPRAGLGIDVGDLELPARRRRRRAAADHTQARHGKAVFRPDRPPRLQNPQPMSELRNPPRKLTPNSATFTRTGQKKPTPSLPPLSRPVEDCEGCPTLAGVRNLAKVSLWAARSGLKNGVVVALRRRRAMVLRGRNLAGRWGRVRALYCCRRCCLAEHAD